MGNMEIENVRLIIFDYDRTITDKDLNFDFRLVDLMVKLRRHGMRFALITGRVFNEVNFLKGYFDIIGCENGAIIIFKNDLYKVNSNIQNELLNILTKNDVELTHGEVVISFRDLEFDKVKKLLHEYDDNIDYIQNKSQIMILPKGINKGYCAKKILQILNVKDSETLAVGDGENDVPMLQAVKYRVCLRNSVEQIRNISDLYIKNENSDGTLDLLNLILKELGDENVEN